MKNITNYIFSKCVDLLLFLGNLIGISYEQINVLIFCIIWPSITIFLIWKLYLKKTNNINNKRGFY